MLEINDTQRHRHSKRVDTVFDTQLTKIGQTQ